MQKAITLGSLDRGLYILQQGSALGLVQQELKGFGAACLSDAKLWHYRLGHLSFEQLNFIDPAVCNNNRHHRNCQICPLAKLHRISFPLSTSRAKQCFDLLHVDIWGPYPYSTHDGAKYFLTIVDDCSRATWVYLIAHKSNAFPLLKAFVIFAENQFGVTVKVMRSDNGLEFKEKTALDFYREKGILHQTSYVDTPQQMALWKENTNIYCKLLELLCYNPSYQLSIGVKPFLLPLI